MWVCVHGDLGMRQWLGGPEGFCQLEDWTQLQRVSFPCGDERCSEWCLRKPPFAAIGIQASEERRLETNQRVQRKA